MKSIGVLNSNKTDKFISPAILLSCFLRELYIDSIHNQKLFRYFDYFPSFDSFLAPILKPNSDAWVLRHFPSTSVVFIRDGRCPHQIEFLRITEVPSDLNSIPEESSSKSSLFLKIKEPLSSDLYTQTPSNSSRGVVSEVQIRSREIKKLKLCKPKFIIVWR